MTTGAYDYLKALSRVGYVSDHFSITFLRGAVEDGIVRDEDLAPIIPILREEMRMSSRADIRALWGGRFGGSAEDGLAAIKRPSKKGRTPPEVVAQKLAMSLYRLAGKYPEAGENFGIMTMAGILRGSSFNAWHSFRHIADSEFDWQSIIRGQFWNSVYLPALLTCEDTDHVEILNGANEFFGVKGIGAGLPTSDDRKALAIQVPILGAAIMAEIKATGRQIDIVELGRVVKAKIDKNSESLSVIPPLKVLPEMPAMVRDKRHPYKRIVSLLLDAGLAGPDAWRRLMETPFFFKHAFKLVPSNAFWRMGFPAEFEKAGHLRYAIARELPDGSREISREKMGDVYNVPEGDVVIYAGERISAGGPPRVTRAIARKGADRRKYGLTIEDGVMEKIGYRPDAALNLDIDGGKIADASYTVMIGKPALVRLNEGQIRILEARARDKYIPYVVAPHERDVENIARQLLTRGQPSAEFAATVAGFGGMMTPRAVTMMPFAQLMTCGVGMALR